MTRVVVLQSNYIPWKGYFDLIRDADVFCFYDDVQFTKNDWRNRNRIKTAQGTRWLSVPVGTDLNRLVCEVRMSDSRWQASHWESLKQAYSKQPYFRYYREFFEEIYRAREWSSLSELNQYLVRKISAELLGIKTRFDDSRNYRTEGRRLERLMGLLKQLQCSHYVSGPAAKDYIDAAEFEAAGIQLVWKDYSGYPMYEQPYPPFEHGVSILDLLFCVGPSAPQYIWGWREDLAGGR
ncbi:MAG: WbqC family protein [Roseateles asaccharophilus]|uniref:WbqC family protein n=1 Tax=Roseateles asaccharophilus TaxID=582607 RepID=UPI00391B3CD7